MRIDIHAYVGHWPFRRLRGSTCLELVQRLDRFGVDRAWVGNINGIFYQNCQSANEELAEAVAEYRNRLVPFAVLNPTYADWEYDLEVCARQLGMKGVRLYPQYHGYAPGDDHCMAIVKAAQTFDLPVAFTLRMVDERQQSWLDPSVTLEMDPIVEVIRKAPAGKFIILHAMPGSARVMDAAAVLRKSRVLCDTLYATGVPIGLINAYPLTAAIRKFGGESFAFGTGTPFRDYPSHLLRIESTEELSDKDREAIWSGNARRIVL
jgi:predicted TIM-barrel fold metal-dependent hydrolase